MAEATIQLGGGNWAGKSDNLLGYYKEGERFYKQDFTFSRSTSGTRVNSSGLIETAQIVSTSEEVTNGNFATNSDWTIESTWTISGGAANGNGASGSTQELKQTSVNTIGKIYKATFEVLNYVSGTVGFWQGSGISVIPRSANGTYTEYFTATSTEIRFRGTNFYGSIDNVSVKEVFQVNIPRVDYLNNSNGSLILEPQRTNIATYSSDYTQSFYIKDSGITATLNQSTSPTGLNDAAKISVTNNGRIYANHTTGTYATSVFIKAGTFSNFKIQGQNVDLGVTPIVTGSLDSEDYGNGWYRLTGYYTGTRSFQVQAYPDNTYSSHTDSGDYYLFGTQIEAGSYPTSLIPTTGTTVTRLADASATTGLSDVIGQTEGTIYGEFNFKDHSTGTRRLLCLTDGSSSNRITTYLNTLNKLSVYIVNGGAAQADIQATILTEGIIKYAVAYANNSIKLYLNGTQVGTDTSATIPATTDLYVGSENGNNPSFFDWNQVTLFDQALTNTELATLTTL